MPSPWSLAIPAAAAATFAATWVLTPAPQASGPAPFSPPSVQAPALQASPVAPSSQTAAELPPPRTALAPHREARRAGRAALAFNRAVLPAVRPARRASVAADSVYYPGCNAVRAAGRAPLFRGQPGYRPEMDGDSDGIACEAHRNRW